MSIRLILYLLGTISWSCSYAALEFEKTDLHFQVGATDREITAVYPFKNAGTAAVEVVQVRSSCDCTSVELAKPRYQPGEKGEIKAVFTFGERTGEQFKQITVRTLEDGRAGRYQMTFGVKIPQLMEVAPLALFWNRAGKARDQTLEIRCPEKPAPATSLQMAGRSARLKTRLETVEPGRHYRLHVEPISTAEPFREEIAIEGTFAEVGKRVIKGYAYVK